MINGLIPPKGEQKWHFHHDPASDNVIISRYPLSHRSHERVIPVPEIAQGFYLGYVGCLINLPNHADIPEVYVVATHFASRGGSGMGARQRHADSIVRHLRELRSGGGRPSLPDATPTVILGDLNVYAQQPKDPAYHLTTLLTGDIVDESTFGPDTKLDWDASFMVEVKPRHNGVGKDWYTWRSDSPKNPYPPGALDRIIYTDSVMKTDHSFVSNTTTMTDEQLSRNGLLRTDVLKESIPEDFDHLPLVADFSFRTQEIERLRSSRKSE